MDRQRQPTWPFPRIACPIKMIKLVELQLLFCQLDCQQDGYCRVTREPRKPNIGCPRCPHLARFDCLFALMGLDWLKKENTHSRLALTKGRQNLAISRFCRLFHTTALDESDSEFPPIYRKHEVSLVHIGRRFPFLPLKAISLGCANRWRWDSWHI